ncbi:cell division protein FtsL [Adlercreutzia faecimuris]|uniref:Cell division protein FtsL n=1 Tax=Adlercreutzia faecimuris TaxID=2897341 RepID=A0ABS9WG12_9ACTN|nr:cell division protein FtsL [Adlercreutzia sp. JBNU-10]MCI2241734.1 cell division protein FtsL [Adlercreutzia sp. JBNU-10]
MSAAPAYAPFVERAPERPRRASVSVVRGQGADARAREGASAIVIAARAIACVVVVLAILGFVRVTLSSATVATALETQKLSSQIDVARSEGSALEVRQSSLANPTRIRVVASSLGMAAPASTTAIDLSGDVVVTDEAGNLSLSGSAAAVAQG